MFNGMGTPSSSPDFALFFAALADPTRLRLLNLMNGREVCVCYFVEILGQSQPKISRHLAYLKRAGIVAARREGKWMHYRIRDLDPSVTPILSAILVALASERSMQTDSARLNAACCEIQRFVSLERAPRPAQLSSTRTH